MLDTRKSKSPASARIGFVLITALGQYDRDITDVSGAVL